MGVLERSWRERFTSPPTPASLGPGGRGLATRRLQERLFGHLAVFLFSIILFIPFLTDCCFILRPNLAILAPFWEPSWGHVGHFFDQNGRAGIGTIDFYVAFAFFSDFFAVLTPSWLHFGSISVPLGPILARFWKFLAPCWHHFGAMLGPLGGRKSWHWMGWWGYAKRQEFEQFWSQNS